MKKEKEEAQNREDQKVMEQMRTLLRKFNGVTPVHVHSVSFCGESMKCMSVGKE